MYYVGALAGGDDMDLLARTGVGRDINRHVYTPEEITAEAERPVVRALIALMRLRSQHPAFDGGCTVPDGPADTLVITWTHGDARATLTVAAGRAALDFTRPDGTLTRVADLLTLTY